MTTIFVRPSKLMIANNKVSIFDTDTAHHEVAYWLDQTSMLIAGNKKHPEYVYEVADTEYVHERIDAHFLDLVEKVDPQKDVVFTNRMNPSNPDYVFVPKDKFQPEPVVFPKEKVQSEPVVVVKPENDKQVK